MKELTIKLLVLIGVMTFVPSAFGCFCITPELTDEFKQAKAVFVGEVLEITAPQSNDDKAPLAARFFQIKFRVQRAWKGTAAGQEYTVLSGNGRGCLAFQAVNKAETYLIFAHAAIGADRWSVVVACSHAAQIRYGAVGAGNFSQDIRRLDLLSGQSFRLRPRFGNYPPVNYRYSWSGSRAISK